MIQNVGVTNRIYICIIYCHQCLNWKNDKRGALQIKKNRNFLQRNLFNRNVDGYAPTPFRNIEILHFYYINI